MSNAAVSHDPTSHDPTSHDPTRHGLSIENLSFGYASRPVIDRLNLQVNQGEVLALMGESGSGKTTLARLISGFLLPSSGSIVAGGTTLWARGTNLAPHRRAVGLVPQEGALFPHLSVAGNVGFGLERRRPDRAARIEACLELVGLGGYGSRRPDELSGGQQQRVAVARAVAPEPRLIILDEPFSALDAALRRTTREQVLAALRAEGATVILVTHDSHEALSSADRVAVLESGRAVQVATPTDLYDHPATSRIAQSCGPISGLTATCEDGQVVSALGGSTWPFGAAVSSDVSDGIGDRGGRGALHGIAWYRPEQIEIRSDPQPAHENWSPATVLTASIDGPDLWLTCELRVPSGSSSNNLDQGAAGAAGPLEHETVLIRTGRQGRSNASVTSPPPAVGDPVWIRAMGLALFEVN